MLIVIQLIRGTSGFSGKYCFLPRAWVPKVKQGSKGKFQTEQRRDSCKVGVGWVGSAG